MENPDLVFQVTGDSQSRNIAGRLNVIAKKLSRLGQTIQTEWIASWWHQPQVDLFATRLNKLPHFVPSLGSGCTQSALGGSAPICLPTGSHFGKVVEKLQDYPCRRNIVIAPGWPNMPWFWDLVVM